MSSCVNQKSTNNTINSSHKEIKISLQNFKNGYDLKMIDTCLIAELTVITVDHTDSVINLVNKCENKILRVLAAKYEYPDGSIEIESSIINDTITTVTIGDYLGDYKEDYYELIQDSIICSWTVKNFNVSEIKKDSIRMTRKIKLK